MDEIYVKVIDYVGIDEIVHIEKRVDLKHLEDMVVNGVVYIVSL